MTRKPPRSAEDDVESVVARERRLLDPEIRSDDAAVRALLHDEFREFGASGTVWDRQSVVRATGGDSDSVRAEDIRAVRLGPDAILVTYTARVGADTSLRSSVWVRVDGVWLLRHHQGTRA